MRKFEISSIQRNALNIVLIYAVFATAWILFSDMIVEALITPPALITLASLMKGWVFVCITSVLLYALIIRQAKRAAPPLDSRAQLPAGLLAWPQWTLYLLAAAFSVGTLVIRSQVAAPSQPFLIILLFPVIVSATLGGFGPGLMATLIVSLPVIQTAVLPAPTSELLTRDLLHWGLLVVNGVLVSLLAEAMRRSWQQTANLLAERLQALRLLESIAESSSEAIYAKDEAGRYLLFNRAASDFVGKTPEEVLGRDDHALFPAAQADKLMEVHRLVMETGEIQTLEQVLDTFAGQRIIQATKGPLRGHDGRIIGTFGISRDITEYRRMQQKLDARGSDGES